MPSPSSDSTRREFLMQTGALAAALGLPAASLAADDAAKADAAKADGAPAAAPAAPAADKIVIGVIGPGGQGSALLNSFVRQPDVEIAYVCDVDENRLGDAASAVEGVSGKAPKAVKDLRQVLDDKDVDAVLIATPDHWHAPATILACDAGKHVYVEKPASHNIREGRLMVEAARRNNKVVQLGTQSRSTPHVVEAMQMIREGAIGEVLISKAWNSQRRGDIGRQQPSDPPAWLDYDAWVGPAPMVPFQPNRLHGVWRWWYAFGTGDIGNDGVHDIDLARWGLGVETHPDVVAAMGGKYVFENDQEFPDTQYVLYQYDTGNGSKKKQLVYEQRIWSPYVQEGYENGNAFYGTNGCLILSKKYGWKLYPAGDENQSSKPIKERQQTLDALPHHRNFLDCIRTGSRPNADIEIGHLSSSLSHLGNIATRLGRTLKFDPKAEQFPGDEEANKLVSRQYREGGHWSVPKGV